MADFSETLERILPSGSLQGKILRDKRVLFVLGITVFSMLAAFLVRRRLEEILMLIPFALFATVIAIKDLRHIFLIAAFFLPLSLELAQFIEGGALTFPSDLAALAMIGILLLKAIASRDYQFPQFRHPLFLVFLLYLGWILVTAITSEIPLVSFKWFAATTWLIGGFWFVTSILFFRARLMYAFVILVGIAFAIAVMGIFVKYGIQGRNMLGLRINPTPFFRDHTVFGTFPTLFIPFFFLFTFSSRLPIRFRLLSGGLLFFLVMGLFFSYSRGAWASSFASLLLMTAFLMRDFIRRFLYPILVVGFAFGVFVLPGFLENAARNRAVSRKDFTQHILSITNFRTDESNSERVNRWQSAIGMFKERPLTGFGPGTYAFIYGRYQLAKYRTLESTNHGDIGTAHNEFLLALSEQGVLGGILALGIFIFPIFFGIRGYLKSQRHHYSLLYLGATFGLIAYFIHSFVNNFLDQDKIGLPFYVFAAMITALDLYHRKKPETASET